MQTMESIHTINPHPIHGFAMSNSDLEHLAYAKKLLENPGITVKLTNAIGAPIEKGFEMLPAEWSGVVEKTTEASLHAALNVSIMSMRGTSNKPASNLAHKLITAASGAAGGAVGLAALPLELPFTTMVMMRSIADIARSEKADIRDPETKMNCLEVFALGSLNKQRNQDTNYYMTRMALARAVTEATEYIATGRVYTESAAAVVRLINNIATRFGLVVSEKLAASVIPLIGAAGGAIINTIFMDHFQQMARGHFIVKRLENTYGSDLVQLEYQNL